MSRSYKKPNKKVAKSCHNNGGCPYCEGNRLHSNKVKEEAAKDQEKENPN